MSDETIGAAIREAASTVSAPQSLRERLADPGPRRTRLPRLALGAGLAAVVIAFAFVLTGGGPTVQDVAAAALHAPTAPARGTAGEWSAVGQRLDSVSGRSSRTVIFRRGGMGVHYAIVGGSPIDEPKGRTVWSGGHPYIVLRKGDTTIVTWRAEGHTCVLASKEASAPEMLAFIRSYYRDRSAES